MKGRCRQVIKPINLKMKYLKIIIFTLFVFSTIDCVAQKTNAEKIVGCWTFKKIDFNAKYDFSEGLIQQFKNSIVCFNLNGKFTTNKAGTNSVPKNGSYKISDDGKTLTQKNDLSKKGVVTDDAKIEFLDVENLILKLEFGNIYFERK